MNELECKYDEYLLEILIVAKDCAKKTEEILSRMEKDSTRDVKMVHAALLGPVYLSTALIDLISSATEYTHNQAFSMFMNMILDSLDRLGDLSEDELVC